MQNLKKFLQKNKSLTIQYKSVPVLKKQSFIIGTNFHSKKFEKIFQKSLSFFTRSGQKNEINKSSFLQNKQFQSQKSYFSNSLSFLTKSMKIQQQRLTVPDYFNEKKTFFAFKSMNDSIILKNLSTSFQNLHHLSGARIKSSHLLFDTKKSNKIQTEFPLASNRKNFRRNEFSNNSMVFLKEENKKMDSLNNNKKFGDKKFQALKNLNFLTSDIFLKRDGFLFFPSKKKFFSQKRISNSSKFLIILIEKNKRNFRQKYQRNKT